MNTFLQYESELTSHQRNRLYEASLGRIIIADYNAQNLRKLATLILLMMTTTEDPNDNLQFLFGGHMTFFDCRPTIFLGNRNGRLRPFFVELLFCIG